MLLLNNPYNISKAEGARADVTYVFGAVRGGTGRWTPDIYHHAGGELIKPVCARCAVYVFGAVRGGADWWAPDIYITTLVVN